MTWPDTSSSAHPRKIDSLAMSKLDFLLELLQLNLASLKGLQTGSTINLRKPELLTGD